MKFFYNGIKGSDGKLQKCYYADGPYHNLPSDCITIHGKHYKGFSEEVRNTFKVENGTELQTDYFENDRIRVFSSHPLYAQVKAAYEKQELHSNQVAIKRVKKAIERQVA